MVLHCIALNCIVLHGIALYCIVLHGNACLALSRTILYYLALSCTILHIRFTCSQQMSPVIAFDIAVVVVMLLYNGRHAKSEKVGVLLLPGQ